MGANAVARGAVTEPRGVHRLLIGVSALDVGSANQIVVEFRWDHIEFVTVAHGFLKCVGLSEGREAIQDIDHILRGHGGLADDAFVGAGTYVRGDHGSSAVE